MTVIATPRLVLRPPEDGDLPAIVRGLNNFAVSQWTARIPFPYGAEDAAEFLKFTREAGPDVLRLAIARDDRLIGVIGIEQGEIGYWLAEPYWGRGLGREAARAMADHHFGIAGHPALVASYHIGNSASRRILADLGFSETGEGRAFSRARSAEVKLMRMKLSREDWKEAKERRR